MFPNTPPAMSSTKAWFYRYKNATCTIVYWNHFLVLGLFIGSRGYSIASNTMLVFLHFQTGAVFIGLYGSSTIENISFDYSFRHSLRFFIIHFEPVWALFQSSQNYSVFAMIVSTLLWLALFPREDAKIHGMCGTGPEAGFMCVTSASIKPPCIVIDNNDSR